MKSSDYHYPSSSKLMQSLMRQLGRQLMQQRHVRPAHASRTRRAPELTKRFFMEWLFLQTRLSQQIRPFQQVRLFQHILLFS
ncbi:MAG: UDP-N-acetyl-D-mannosaminuronic acid transferase (WecB/TagA/CpsF family) [Janthinobacterium sp.]|jgi:UDP-N-acetyl-D-mannosaminuronic acid transferase (WecB/TagA/CpsF family)